MSAEIPDAELDRIALSYRFWRAVDITHTPSALAKEQLKAIETAAGKLDVALSALDCRARELLFQRVPHELSSRGALLDRESGLLRDPAVAQNQIAHLASALVESARLAQLEIPRTEKNGAAQFAAVQLENLFSHYGVSFTATANEYGNKSAAVAALIEVVRRAGDTITPDAARNRIAFAIHERNAKDRDAMDQNTGDAHPMR